MSGVRPPFGAPNWGLVPLRVALALVAALLVTAAPSPQPARAALIESALGIPCLPGPGGVRICQGKLVDRVPSWDGTPLDVDVFLPPVGKPAPYPLIVGLHGMALNKLIPFENDEFSTNSIQLRALGLAEQGYAVMAYTARGLHTSCGLPLVRELPGCERGWTHLADMRHEIRDTQHLAGRLADEGWIKPQRIGVTGSSYGAGQSLLLATLRDRMMLPSGKLVPWISPGGKRMEIAAAQPRVGWSDLAYAIAPTGRKLDFRARNPYGRRVGIVKQSYLDQLYLATNATGWIPPPGKDPSADLTGWKAEIDRGEPYDPEFERAVRRAFLRYRSAYYLLSRSRRPPAPTVIYNAWSDDIMPPDQALHYYNLARERFARRARVGLVFADELAHDRGSLIETPHLADEARDELFARHLLGDRDAKPLQGAIAKTQACGDAPALGPFRTRSWQAQHPGEVRIGGRAAQTFDSNGGIAAHSEATDPQNTAAGALLGACRSVLARRDPGAATYESPPAAADGFTLIGSPTISARIRVRGRWPQIVARLWDVAPTGEQTMVQHSPYRPRRGGRQTFQMIPAGWHFAPGHVAKLELLGRDAPYAKPSNGEFEIEVSDLRLELPVRERPDGGSVRRFAPPRRGSGPE